jgi:Fanconi-associated nuclease 1
LPDYHGLWYERLALDLDGHLKRPEVALQAVEAGLNDDNVRVARKLTLCQRAVKVSFCS